MRLREQIDGFTVEIEPDDNGVGCWISQGRHAGSLALCQDYGTVGEDGPPISNATLAKIEKRALANGY